jgi:hypothetical protein
MGWKLRCLPRLLIPLQLAAFITFAAVISSSDIASADEDGVSFWIPGFFGGTRITIG